MGVASGCDLILISVNYILFRSKLNQNSVCEIKNGMESTNQKLNQPPSTCNKTVQICEIMEIKTTANQQNTQMRIKEIDKIKIKNDVFSKNGD